MMKAVFLCLLLAIPTRNASGMRSKQASAVTPVEKVISLLENLQVKVEEEGKAEAKAYDKYACFCKEQADEKLYAMKTSTKEISALRAKITALDAEITGLNGDISDVVSSIADLKTEIENITTTRDVEHAGYKVQDKNMTDAIDAVDGAIEAMKQSKSDLQGKVDLDSPALTQVRALLQTYQQPAAYKFQSNDIIAVLESLKTQFTDRKNKQDQEEFEVNSVFEKRRLGLQNEKKFAEQESAEKQELVAAKSEAKATSEEEKSEETDAKAADQSFMDELTSDCETKAGLFDQRSKARSNELTALAEALGHLKTGVAENYGANKKLVGLQKPAVSKSVSGGHWVWVEDAVRAAGAAPSFLQLRGAAAAAAPRKPTQEVVALLMRAASRLGSSVLTNAALRTQASEDHFVKVRALIKDLVAKLEADSLSEQTEKGYCDKGMAAATTKRDKKKELLEDLEGQSSAAEAKKNRLLGGIAVLSKEIADNNRALAEATELRDGEKQDNTRTIADAGAGKAAVDMALSVLKTFYDNAALAQYTPPKSDREGKTVADRAPAVFDGEYGGSQSESSGIIGMLTVIQADFERTETTVSAEEKDAAKAFADFKLKTEEDTNIKTKAKTGKSDQVTSLEDKLVDLVDQTNDAQKALESALADLEVLKERCVEGEESYEARVEKRKKEIEALKEAMTVLENWSS